jgi:hypothetical protein
MFNAENHVPLQPRAVEKQKSLYMIMAGSDLHDVKVVAERLAK